MTNVVQVFKIKMGGLVLGMEIVVDPNDRIDAETAKHRYCKTNNVPMGPDISCIKVFDSYGHGIDDKLAARPEPAPEPVETGPADTSPSIDLPKPEINAVGTVGPAPDAE